MIIKQFVRAIGLFVFLGSLTLLSLSVWCYLHYNLEALRYPLIALMIVSSLAVLFGCCGFCLNRRTGKFILVSLLAILISGAFTYLSWAASHSVDKAIDQPTFFFTDSNFTYKTLYKGIRHQFDSLYSEGDCSLTTCSNDIIAKTLEAWHVNQVNAKPTAESICTLVSQPLSDVAKQRWCQVYYGMLLDAATVLRILKFALIGITLMFLVQAILTAFIAKNRSVRFTMKDRY